MQALRALAAVPSACRFPRRPGPVERFEAVSDLPGPLAALARQVAGELTDVTDCSWQRDSSAVWQLTGASGGCWYLKRHSSGSFHAREVAALRGWARALGPGRAPELAAADPELLVMIVMAVPGESVPGLGLGPREEREAHRQAGVLLGRLHESRQAAGSGADVGRLAGRVDGYLGEVGGLLTPAQRALVRECAGRLAWLGPGSRPLPATGISSLGTGSGTRALAGWASLTGNGPSPRRSSVTWPGWNTARGIAGRISASRSSRVTGARLSPKSARCWPATPSWTLSAACSGAGLTVTKRW